MAGPKYGNLAVKNDRHYLRVIIDGKSRIVAQDINNISYGITYNFTCLS